jgi:hypothetical protein
MDLIPPGLVLRSREEPVKKALHVAGAGQAGGRRRRYAGEIDWGARRLTLQYPNLHPL